MFRNLVKETMKERFISSFLEQTPLIFQGDGVDGFSWLMDSEEISLIFQKKASRYYKVFSTFHGNFQELRDGAKEALRRYEQGFPIWIRNLNDFHSSLRELCFSLDRELCCKEVFASLVWIPEEADEFNFCLDAFDSFHINLDGDIQMKLSVLKKGGDFRIKNIDPGGKGWDFLEEVTLKKGDMIYVPRNVCVTVKGGGKFSAKSIVLGFANYTWGDVIDKLLYVKLSSSKNLKGSVPEEWLEPSLISTSEENKELIKNIKNTFSGTGDFALVKAMIRRERSLKLGASPGGIDGGIC
jgi:hypothetical protein